MAVSKKGGGRHQREMEELKKALSELEKKNARLEEQNKELSKKQELMDALLDNVPDSIYFKDRKNRFLLASRSCTDKHDLQHPSDIIGKSDGDFFPEHLAQEWMDEEDRLMKTGESIIGREELEVWYDGRETWAHTTKVPLYNKRGEVIGTFGISRDITKLKETEEKLGTLIDNIPDIVFFKDRKSRFVLVNKSCARKHGFEDPEKMRGKTDFDFYKKDFAKQTSGEEQRVMQTDKPLIGKEEYQRLPDGREIWMLATKMPWKDNQGRIKGTFGISRDITKIKQAEHQLQTLMDNIPDKIFFKDRNSRFIKVNKATAKTFDMEEPADAVGKNDFDFFPPGLAEMTHADDRKIVETGRPIIGKEDFETWTTGEKKWVSVTKLPFRDVYGNIIGTFGISRDINRLKIAEEQLQKSNERLEKTVQKRTAELRKANEGMKTRIQQLDYLNKKAHFLTQLIDRDTLLPVIFYAFVERFPDGEVLLCDMGPKGFRTAYHTDGLRDRNILSSCIRALEYLESEKEGGLFMEKCWMDNSQLKDLFSQKLKKLSCYIVIPLITDRKLRGAVQVFVPEGFTQVYDQEYMVLNTLAAQAAMSLDNANNYQRLAERTRIQSELEIAQGIQRRFTPEDPVIPGLKIKGVCHPANEVGGDYLDFFQNNFGEWVLVIADVCGKGIPAALVMTSLRSIIRTEAREQSSSRKLLSTVNNLMVADLQADNSFITCMAIIINKESKSMNFTRAGHPMIIDYGPGNQPKTVPSRGIALGMIAGDSFTAVVEEIRLDLKKGDKFLAYTDGLNEAMNPRKNTYGLDRLLILLREKQALQPDQLVQNILQDVEDFCEGSASMTISRCLPWKKCEHENSYVFLREFKNIRLTILDLRSFKPVPFSLL
jgi:PAS domain S-box-containing protein